MSFVLQFKSIIPLTTQELGVLFSPYGYHFHFVGIIIGIAISMWIFLRNIQSPAQEARWIDTIFFALTAAMIPLCLLLLL